jgi:protein transport protein SEC31
MEALQQTQLTAVDSRHLAESEKAVAILMKRLARGDIPEDVIGKVGHMTSAITGYDWRTAQSIQTGLVNSDWRDHKDWLKGIKALLQLSAKKFAT